MCWCTNSEDRNALALHGLLDGLCDNEEDIGHREEVERIFPSLELELAENIFSCDRVGVLWYKVGGRCISETRNHSTMWLEVEIMFEWTNYFLRSLMA